MSRNATDPETGDPKMGSALALGIVFLLTAVILLAVFVWVRLVRRQIGPPIRRAVGSNGTVVSVEETTAEVGLDPETLESYPKVVYSKKLCRTKSEAQERSCCSICLCDYQESEDILRLLPDCGHMFHVECIDQWLKLHPTCPMCRTSPLPSPMMSPLSSSPVPLLRHDSLSDRHVSFSDSPSVQV